MKKLFFVFLIVAIIGTVAFGCSETTTTTITTTTTSTAATTTSTTTKPTTTTSTTTTPPTTTTPKPITIKFGTDLPPTFSPVVGLHWWADEVTKQTQGRVKVEMYPASSLSDQASGLDNVLAGVCDMYYLSISSHRKSFPISSIAGLPGVGFPDESLEGNTAHLNTFFEVLQKYPAAAAEFEDFGPMFLYVIYSESYMVSKGKQIRVPDDVKGVKLGSNGIRQDFAAMIGAVPVTDIPPTAYEKLQTGVTQATFAAISAVHDFQLFEVSDYILDFPFGGGGMPCVINKDVWNKISPQDQEIMKKLAPEGSKRSHQALADANSAAWQEIVDKGMKTTTTAEEKAAWEAALKPLWDGWVTEAKAAGLTNAEDMFNYWKAASDKAWGE